MPDATGRPDASTLADEPRVEKRRRSGAKGASLEPVLREVVEALAPLERGAGSAGEEEAARWLAQRLQQAGCDARVEEEQFRPGFPEWLVPLGAAGVVAGVAALAGRRAAPAVLGATAAAAIADDASNGPRIWRRLVAGERATWNVVGEVGHPQAARTLVVLAHHDAAHTGRVFDQSFQRWLAATFPEQVARTNTSLPLWWPIAGAPAISALGAATGRRGLAALGAAWSLLNTYLGADVARSQIVPGANDNLSGVAVLVALAERLRDEVPPGVRVVLASCGAEEVVQGGIYGFAERHFPELARDRTAILNLDSVGSPYLVMLEGEGTFVMEDYTDPGFRDLVAGAADAAGVRLARGARARSSTDAVIPSRAGFPTTTLTSLEPGTKLISNYHLPTDTPENLDYGTVAEAALVAEEVARALSAAG
jgi:hypothetical protein